MLPAKHGSTPSLGKMAITVEIPTRLEITRALYSSTCNVHVVNHNVAAAALAAENIVVPSFLGRCTSNVPHGDVLDLDTVGGVACWAAVEVILLDIDSIDGDVLNADVLENNVGDEACCVGV